MCSQTPITSRKPGAIQNHNRSDMMHNIICTTWDVTGINFKMKSIMKEELEAQNAWQVISGTNPDSKAGRWKRFKAWTKGVVPVSIL